MTTPLQTTTIYDAEGRPIATRDGPLPTRTENQPAWLPQVRVDSLFPQTGSKAQYTIVSPIFLDGYDIPAGRTIWLAPAFAARFAAGVLEAVE